MTAREMADQVLAAREKAWSKADHTTAIVVTEQLNPDDVAVVRKIVAKAGYSGDEFEKMVRHVSGLVVGTVEALADDLPATGGD